MTAPLLVLSMLLALALPLLDTAATAAAAVPVLTATATSPSSAVLRWHGCGRGGAATVWRQFAIQSRRGQWLLLATVNGSDAGAGCGRGNGSESVTESVGMLGATTYPHRVCCLGSTSDVGSPAVGLHGPTEGDGSSCSAIVNVTTHPAFPRLRGRVVAPASAEYPRNGEGTIVRLRGVGDGSGPLAGSRGSSLLLLFLSRQSANEDVGASNVTLMRSPDNGATWSLPVQVPPDTSEPSRANPGAAVLPNGTVVLTYFVGASQAAARRVVRHSHDGCRTWTPERNLTDGSYAYMTGAHDRLRMLSNGRLAQTVHAKLSAPGTSPVHLGTFVYTSDNGGLTWARRGLAGAGTTAGGDVVTTPNGTWLLPGSGVAQVPSERGFYEASLVETDPSGAPGCLLMVARTASGWLYQSVSTDYGTSWSPPVRSTIRHPLAPANIARLPAPSSSTAVAAGQQSAPPHLVLLTEPHFTGTGAEFGTRFVLGLQRSADGGRTWCNFSAVEYSGGDTRYSYPSVFVEAAAAAAGEEETRGEGRSRAPPQSLHVVYRGVDLPGLPVGVSAVYQQVRLAAPS